MRCYTPWRLTILGAALLGGTQAAVLPDHECRKTKVAILGAGVSGMTAAQALANASVSEFVIVERNNYIGGRLAAVEFGTNSQNGRPYTVELGANWVQGLGSKGGPENPVWTLAKKHSINSTYSNYSSIKTFDETGPFDFTHLLDVWEERYAAVEQDAGYILADNLQDTSIRAGLSLRDWKPRKDMHRQAVEWWEWDWEIAQPPEQSSLAFGIAGYNLTFYQFSEDNNFVWDQRGFRTFIVEESKSFLQEDDGRLLLNTTVNSITYSTDGVVVSTDGGCIQADYAIATFSVGVLQSDRVSFDPPLPRWKREAIEQFYMGTYTKIFYQFNETFWDPDIQFFLYADPKVRGYFPVWQSLSGPGFLQGSNIIFATVVGDESYRIEKQTDEETMKEGLAVLRTMFPGADIPEPAAFAYPRWSEEEWAFGSYSNWPVGMTLEKHQNLRANVDRLWFAGEANSAQYFGFLHGAWFEGREVGERIGQLLTEGGLTKSSLNCTEPGVCGPMLRHENLHGTTSAEEYNIRNGWAVSSLLTYGLRG